MKSKFEGRWSGTKPVSRRRFLAIPLLLLAQVAVGLLVYQTGGIKFVYSHTMYLPIVLTGFLYGAPGGLVAGVVGGLILGPYMPLVVETGEMQIAVNWLYRIAFFSSVGLLSGILSTRLHARAMHNHWLAHHDQFSGLPNRRSLIASLERNLTQHAEGGLIVVYTANISEINTTVGFEVGDALIKGIGDRLSEYLPTNSSVYHFHPDRVAAYIPEYSSPDAADRLEELYELLQAPFDFHGIPIHVDCHIGYVPLTGGENTDVRAPMRQADFAARVAQEEGAHFRMAGNEVATVSAESLETLGLLRQAIVDNDLFLDYQPKYELATGRIIGAEGLVRWNHPTKGLVPPGSFVPKAEESTLIDALTRWVLVSAVNQIVSWREQGLSTAIAINISTRNLYSPLLTSLLVDLIHQNKIHPGCIELEVTETALMKNPDRAMHVLSSLAEVPIAIAIDDFGTGFSSLQYLGKIPASIIKIDQTFIRHLMTDPTSQRIVDGTVDLAHRLGMKVVAEGIEDESALEYLRRVGCDIGQGYFLSRPVSPDRVLELCSA